MRYSIVIGLLSITAGTPARAQTDPAGQAHQMSANQLGMLQYCKAQGYVGDDAIAAERSSIAKLPPSAVSTDAAEAAGKNGAFLAPNGTTTTMASMASGQGHTVGDLCKQMGSAVIQTTTMMQNMPAGMPAMPGATPRH